MHEQYDIFMTDVYSHVGELLQLRVSQLANDRRIFDD